MKDSQPGKQPKPQSKWSGGPPKPPKKTARDLLDGGGSGDFSEGVLAVVSHASEIWFELEKLKLGGAAGPRIRESLEVNLDLDIVVLGGVFQEVKGVVRERVIDCLKSARDYRLHCPRQNPSDPKQARQAQKVLDKVPQA